MDNNRTKVGVIWFLLTDTAIFYTTVKLKCKVPRDICCNRNVRKWSRSPESIVLLFNGDPKKERPLKYSENIEKDGFIINIYNFSAEDINKNYTCSYGFAAYSKPLPIAEFELHPNNETLETSFDISTRGELNISVYFRKVYPIPRCTIIVDGKNESTKLMFVYSKVDIFYSAEFIYNNNTCKNNFIFNCSVGLGYSFEEQQQCSNNSDATVSHGKSKSLYLLILLVLVLPVIVIVIVLCRRAYKKMKNSLHDSTGKGGRGGDTELKEQQKDLLKVQNDKREEIV